MTYMQSVAYNLYYTYTFVMILSLSVLIDILHQPTDVIKNYYK